MKRFAAYLVMGLAEVIGGGALVLFAIFVFAGPVAAVRLDVPERGVLYWNALLSFLWFTQHSLMVRRWFKDWLARWIARDFHGAVYAILSGAVLALVMVMWQPSSGVVFSLNGPAAWLLRTIAVLALAGFVWSFRSLRSFDTFGRLPIMARLRGRALPESRIVMRGAYRWMRHPFMAFMLVLLWTNPHMSADRMLFNVLWTAWMIIGIHWEERDLVAELGEPYRAYQRIVPMLCPWRGPAPKSARL